jgi:hypothetical protein
MSFIVNFLQHAIPSIAEGGKDILLRGFDQNDDQIVALGHFVPCTEWEEEGGYKLIDKGTGEVYWKDSPSMKRLKCLALAGATPVVQTIALVLNLVNRIAKLVTFAHFWSPDSFWTSTGETIPLKDRLIAFGKDLLRVVLTPVILAVMFVVALCGAITPLGNGPYDAGKLYATAERFAFGKDFLAPCFAPFAVRHLGGGTPGANAW